MWDLPRAGIESTFPALAGGFLATGPLGKSKTLILKLNHMTLSIFDLLIQENGPFYGQPNRQLLRHSFSSFVSSSSFPNSDSCLYFFLPCWNLGPLSLLFALALPFCQSLLPSKPIPCFSAYFPNRREINSALLSMLEGLHSRVCLVWQW